jgi:hypothetical protein
MRSELASCGATAVRAVVGWVVAAFAWLHHAIAARGANARLASEGAGEVELDGAIRGAAVCRNGVTVVAGFAGV